MIGDSILYYFGRISINNGVPTWLKFFGINRERVLFIKRNYSKHPKKIFLIGKISHGIGAAALFAAGAVQFPFGKFLLYNVLPTLLKSLILLLIGYYFGRAYSHIKTYLDYVAITAGIFFAITYIIFLKYSNSYFQK